MYPIKIKENTYKSSILDKINDIIDLITTGIENFRSPKTLIIFLQKSFHF